jgi:hypothetical protein
MLVPFPISLVTIIGVFIIAIIRMEDDMPIEGQPVRFLHCRVVNEPHSHILSQDDVTVFMLIGI